MNGYKIVTNCNGRLSSAFVNLPGMVEYKVDEWVTPKNGCGPLAVFYSLGGANIFARGHCASISHEIYSCEYELSGEKTMWTVEQTTGMLPPGTILASSVKLVGKPLFRNTKEVCDYA